MKIYVIALSAAVAVIAASTLQAQKNSNQSASPQGQTQGQSAGGSVIAQGITWPHSAWESLTNFDVLKQSLHLSPKDEPVYLLCYSLDITTGSLSTPPYVLRQVNEIPDMNHRCFNTANAKKPLLARGFLGVAIDARHVPTARMQSFNLVLTTASGQPINLYPVRPSVAASSSSSSGGGAQTSSNTGGGADHTVTPPPTWGDIYYLLWTQELGGDQIPTITVSLAFTPPVPGTPWQPITVYPEGSIVIPGNAGINVCESAASAGVSAGGPTSPPAGSNSDASAPADAHVGVLPPAFTGHYFVARTGGLSAASQPHFCVPSIKDGAVWWVDSGTTQPADAPTSTSSQSTDKTSTSVTSWAQITPYSVNAVVYYALTGHYYVATQKGVSGLAAPFSLKTIPDQTNLSWAIFGRNPPPVGAAPEEWHPGPYSEGQAVYDPESQLYFTARVTNGASSGTSGSTNPFRNYSATLQFPDPSPPVAPSPSVLWVDVGSTAPVPYQPGQLAIPTRAVNHWYNLGDIVFDPPSGHFFISVRAGTSSDSAEGVLAANMSYRIPDGESPGNPPKAIKQDFLQVDRSGSFIRETDGEWMSLKKSTANLYCENQSPYPTWSEKLHLHPQDCVSFADENAYFVFQLHINPHDPDAMYVAAAPGNLKLPPMNAPDHISEFFTNPQGTSLDLLWMRPRSPDGSFTQCIPSPDNSPYANGFCQNTATPGVSFQLSGPGMPLESYPQINDFRDVSQILTRLSVLVNPRAINPMEWEDIGTSVPALVSSGEPAAQTVAQAYTLTQVHAKYYFNLSTGLVVSSIHSRAFGWMTNAPGFYTPIRVSSNPIVDPVLFLTVYLPKPMDAESPWNKKNMIPAPTFGMSFTSPTSNFYLGLSSEVRRNIQIVFGASTAEPQRLSSTSVSATNMGTPPTSQKFTMGGFVGFSVNISGFIQTVLGGGK